jgi:hypothetical protein
MKFSTIGRRGNHFDVFPGATFNLSINGSGHRSQIDTASVMDDKYLLRDGGAVAISNELLVGPDALVHLSSDKQRQSVTVLRAAVRLGSAPVLVPESEGARCEVKHQAHAVWIPDDGTALSDPGATFEGTVAKMTAGLMSDDQILMPGLAILTEGNVLRVQLLRCYRTRGLIVKPVREELCSFRVTFDGTNLKLHGAEAEALSQECYV